MAKGERARRVDFEVSRRLSYRGEYKIPGDVIQGMWEEEAQQMESWGWGKIVESKKKDHDT